MEPSPAFKLLLTFMVLLPSLLFSPFLDSAIGINRRPSAGPDSGFDFHDSPPESSQLIFYGCWLPFGSIELPAPLGSIALPAPARTLVFTFIALAPLNHLHSVRRNLSPRGPPASAVWIDASAVTGFDSCFHLHVRVSLWKDLRFVSHVDRGRRHHRL